jgi:hypothetical protein
MGKEAVVKSDVNISRFPTSSAHFSELSDTNLYYLESIREAKKLWEHTATFGCGWTMSAFKFNMVVNRSTLIRLDVNFPQTGGKHVQLKASKAVRLLDLRKELYFKGFV